MLKKSDPAGALTDQRLVASARSGDPEAIEDLLRLYQSKVYRFGMKMCGDPEDAKDILQETLLAMARSLREFRGESTISTWLFTIARRFCLKKRRTSRFAPVREQSLETGVPESELPAAQPEARPDQAFSRKELRDRLDTAIRQLEPSYREVLLLRDVEGFTTGEVGKILGISSVAVKSRLNRARAAVRGQLAGSAPSLQDGCPDIVDLFSRNLEGDISQQTCVEMQRHLLTCPECHRICDSLKETLALCAATPQPAVPPDIQKAVRSALRSLRLKGSK